jgi:ketosteroid isomerase-like protein
VTSIAAVSEDRAVNNIGRDPEVQRFVDEASIRRVMCRYARGIDRCDWELVRSCYHADAFDEHGGGRSVEEFIAWIRPLTEQLESTAHVLGNQLAEFDESGDVAWVETYLVALRRTRADGDQPALDIFGNGRYFDRFERRDGEWRIAHRKVIFRAGRVDEAESPYSSLLAPAAGSRDRDDPTYHRF